MKTTIAWSKLVNQGRAKAHGVPWSKEEENALKAGMTPDDVRAGLFSGKDVKKADKIEEKSGERPLIRMKRDELIEIAKEMEIDFDVESVTRAALMSEIVEARKK